MNHRASAARIARSTPDRIFVRNVDLVDQLIGKISFTEMMLLHYTGQRPTAVRRASSMPRWSR